MENVAHIHISNGAGSSVAENLHGDEVYALLCDEKLQKAWDEIGVTLATPNWLPPMVPL